MLLADHAAPRAAQRTAMRNVKKVANTNVNPEDGTARIAIGRRTMVIEQQLPKDDDHRILPAKHV
jgi:hypothetical protein